MAATGPMQLLPPRHAASSPDLRSSASAPALGAADGDRAANPPPKTTMDDFDVVQLLGKGAYGRALLCRDRRAADDEDDRVVVKQVVALDAENAAEAKREASILSRLDHPNVVAFYESFVLVSDLDGATLHIVMEYCDGGDLDGAIRNRRKRNAGPFDEGYVMRVFVQLLLALKHDRRRLRRSSRFDGGLVALVPKQKRAPTRVAPAQVRPRAEGPPPRHQAAEHFFDDDRAGEVGRLWRRQMSIEYGVHGADADGHAVLPLAGNLQRRGVPARRPDEVLGAGSRRRPLDRPWSRRRRDLHRPWSSGDAAATDPPVAGPRTSVRRRRAGTPRPRTCGLSAWCSSSSRR